MEKFIATVTNEQRSKLYAEEKNYFQTIEKESGNFKLVDLKINTKFSDYAPSFNHKGELVYSSVDDTINKKKKK